jgi:pyrimidine 5'-nucleotidase
MTIKCVFFDLDGTLYPASTGLWLAIKQRIDAYLQERMQLSPEKARTIRQQYLEKYGTTLRGLQLEHHIDTRDYLDYVHDLPIENYLHPNPEVNRMIRQIMVPKWVFTNSDLKHSQRILTFLGLSDEFDGIIDIYALDFVCKPQVEAYYTAMKIAQQTDVGDCLFIDDSKDNITHAKRLGFLTVLVSENGNFADADFTINDLRDIQHFYPQLWTQDNSAP